MEARLYLTMTYFDGRRVEAVVLAVGKERMRISIADQADAMELRLMQGVWMTESHEPVELEALVAGEGLASIFSELCPATQTAIAAGVV